MFVKGGVKHCKKRARARITISTTSVRDYNIHLWYVRADYKYLWPTGLALGWVSATPFATPLYCKGKEIAYRVSHLRRRRKLSWATANAARMLCATIVTDNNHCFYLRWRRCEVSRTSGNASRASASNTVTNDNLLSPHTAIPSTWFKDTTIAVHLRCEGKKHSMCQATSKTMKTIYTTANHYCLPATYSHYRAPM